MARTAPLPLAIAATGVPVFMATLDNLVVTTALPVLPRELGASLDALQWITNAYTLAFAALMLFAAGLGDRLGRRRVFVAGVVLFTLASAAAGLSTDPVQLIAARAAQGLGAAAIMPLSLALLAGSVGERRRPLAIGVWGGISGLGVALGPVVGGAVLKGWTWSGIFWLNVPVGVVAVALVLLALPAAAASRGRLDASGLLLASAGLVALVWGVVRGDDAGWASTEVLGSLAAAAVLLTAFVLRERRAAAPLLPLRLFRRRAFALVNVVALVFSFGAFGAVFLLVQFLQVVQGHDPLTAGLMTLPWTAAPMVVAPLAGRLAPRVGTRALIVVGLVALAAGIGWIGWTMTASVAYAAQLPGYALAGLGMGLVFAPLSTVVLAGLPERDHARASSTSSTLREVGTALGVAVLTAVFTGAGGTLTPTGFVDAARPAVLVGAAAIALAAVVAVALPGRVRGPVAALEPVAEPEAVPLAA